MEIIKGNFNKITDILLAARQVVVLAMPNVSVEIAEILVEIKKRFQSVIIYLDIREEVYREGYGDIEALGILEKANIEIMDLQGLNISFILVDEKGYFYFLKSRYFEEEGSSFDLIPMHPEQVQLFKNSFSDTRPLLFQEIITGNDKLELEVVKNNATRLTDEKKNALEKKLKEDPPLKPDLKRTLTVYTGKYQFAELKFKGANFHIKKIKLPQNALPFKDSELSEAIEASLRLFTNIPEKEFFAPFFDFKLLLDELRQDYLVYLKSREKNLINRDKKGEFLEKIESLKLKLSEVVEEIFNDLQKEIGNTRGRIFKTLLDFLINNPTEELNSYSKEVRENESDNLARMIVSKIQFPSARTLLKGVGIECHFYDITWDDLNNKEVIAEMRHKELLNSKEEAYLMEKAVGSSTGMV
jgi:hypothetical protein